MSEDTEYIYEPNLYTILSTDNASSTQKVIRSVKSENVLFRFPQTTTTYSDINVRA